MEITCKICGKTEDISHWCHEDRLKKRQMCFLCDFWQEQLELDQNERGEYGWAMINGTHYVLSPHVSHGFVGFGGAKFTIQFNDGTVVECDNLWCQGQPTGVWKEKFPDNAKFIKNGEAWC